jgi:16S rRNA (cytosine967-C5)-methyltransferase
VLDVLRLGAHQLLATRFGAHAAVATSVDLARQVAGPGAAGFGNAVLRRVATRDLEGWITATAPSRAADLVGHLAIRYSHPRWIVDAISASLAEEAATGLSETEAVLAASAGRPRVALCAVPGLADQAELLAGGAEPARWSPFGAYLESGDPARVAAVGQGRAAVQDEASQLAALALTRVDVGAPDRRWLDLCAGPGGKARLLAGLAAGRGARLLAADARPHRARLVRAAVSGAAGVIVADGTAPAWRPGSFDRVIADVPCSGLGALRRRPEARWRKSPADVAALGGLQRRLLASALDAVRPGGAVAYVTCSPHTGETRAVVADVLRERDDVSVLDAPAVLAEVPSLRCPGPDGRYAQFWQHRHGTDAIFLALLQRHPAAG